MWRSREDCWWHTRDTWNRSHHGRIYPYEIKQPEKRKPHFTPFKKPYPHSGSDPQRGNELPPKPQHQLLSGSGGADYTCVNHPPGREGWWAALWGLRTTVSMEVVSEVIKSWHGCRKTDITDLRINHWTLGSSSKNTMKANPKSDEVSDEGQTLGANVGWKLFADNQASVWKEVNNNKKKKK